MADLPRQNISYTADIYWIRLENRTVNPDNANAADRVNFGVVNDVLTWVDSAGNVFTAAAAGSGVTSFNARTGAVVPAEGDYSLSLLSDVSAAAQTNHFVLASSGAAYAGRLLTAADVTGGTFAAGAYIFEAPTATTVPVTIRSTDDNPANFAFKVVSSANALRLGITPQGYLQTEPTSDTNTRLGLYVGEDIVVGATDNTLIGYVAGGDITTGDQNVAVGSQALRLTTTGVANVAIGTGALHDNTGDYNSAFGTSSLYSNQGGSYNIGFGLLTLFSNTSGNFNVAIGASALQGNSTQTGNVAIGHGAATTGGGDYNVFIGFNAAANETGSNKLYIENTNSASPLIYGEFDNNLIRIHGTLEARVADAVTNAVTDVAFVTHNSSGTPAANFGTGFLLRGESTTTENTEMVRLRSLWTTATHASRKARGILSAYDTAERDCIKWEASGTAPMLGFFGTNPVVKPTVTGSRGGNAALASLLTALAGEGLIVDSSSA